MTQQRKLKRRIRERMAKTGERFSTARQHILEQRLFTIRGQVIGGPIPGAWLCVELLHPQDTEVLEAPRFRAHAWDADPRFDPELPIDERGAFALDLRPGHYLLFACAPGRALFRRRLTLPEDAGLELAIELPPSPTAELALRLVDAAGDPLPHMEFSLQGRDLEAHNDPLVSRRSKSDAEGRAALLFKPGTYTLKVYGRPSLQDRKGLTSDDFPVILAPDQGLELTQTVYGPSSRGAITLRCLDREGRPLEGASVTLRDNISNELRTILDARGRPLMGRGHGFAETDAEGLVCFENLDLGAYKAYLRSGFFGQELGPLMIERRGQERGPIDVRLEDALEHGHLRIRCPQAVSDGNFYLRRETGDRIEKERIQDARDGELVVYDLRPGHCTFAVSGEGRGVFYGATEFEAEVRVGETTTIDLSLRAADILTGRVVHADGSPALGWVFPGLAGDKVHESRSGIPLDQDGGFRYRKARRGQRYTFAWRCHEGFANHEFEARHDGRPLELSLPADGPRVRVIDPQGAPLYGAYVGGSHGETWREGSSDSQGWIRFAEPITSLHAQRSGYQSREEKGAFGAGDEVVLTLSPGPRKPKAPCILKGRVINAEGSGLGAVRVELRRGDSYSQTHTDEDGDFRLMVLAEGEAQLMFRRADRPVCYHPVTLRAGVSIADIEVTMTSGFVVSGRVEPAPGQALIMCGKGPGGSGFG